MFVMPPLVGGRRGVILARVSLSADMVGRGHCLVLMPPPLLLRGVMDKNVQMT